MIWTYHDGWGQEQRKNSSGDNDMRIFHLHLICNIASYPYILITDIYCKYKKKQTIRAAPQPELAHHGHGVCFSHFTSNYVVHFLEHYFLLCIIQSHSVLTYKLNSFYTIFVFIYISYLVLTKKNEISAGNLKNQGKKKERE